MFSAAMMRETTMLWKRPRYNQDVYAWDLLEKGERNAFLGLVAEKKRGAYLALDELTKHVIIAGATGGGKTVAGQIIVEEALLRGVSVVAVDPTGQWTGFLHAMTDTQTRRLYTRFDLPLSAPRQFPTMMAPLTAENLPRIEECFTPGTIRVLLAGTVDTPTFDALLSRFIDQFFHASLPESKELRLLLVFDEIHRVLPRYGGTGAGFVALERAVREFRKWGIGVILISQVLEDFIGAIRGNIGTQIQMRTAYDEDLSKLETKYGKEITLSVVRAEVGTGMLQNAAYNVGNPFFIRFRPPLHSFEGLEKKELDEYLSLAAQLERWARTIHEPRTIPLAQRALAKGEFAIVKSYLEETERKR